MKKIFLKHFLLLMGFIAYSSAMYAQETTLLTQQWFSRINRNPAAAAAENHTLNLGLFYYNQWTGVEGTPQTVLFNGSTYLDHLNSGFGLSVNYDSEGKSLSNLNAMVSYGYRLQLGNDIRLSFGIAAGIMHINNDPLQNTWGNPTDPNIPTDRISQFNPDFNFGGELSFKRFTFGIACDHLLNSTTGTSEEPKTAREIYSYAHYNFVLSENFELAPQVSWVYFSGTKNNLFEVGAVTTYKKMCWAGASWRNEALGFMLGVDYFDIRLGMVYQMSIGDINKVAKNTIELMLQYRFGNKK